MRGADIDDRHERTRSRVQWTMFSAACREAKHLFAAYIAAEPADLIHRCQGVGEVVVGRRARESLALGGHLVPSTAIVRCGHGMQVSDFGF